MFQQIKKLREKEEGFTLIELLVVIAILGILAGVVVFAVGGLGDKGQKSACKIDTRTLRTAEEANFVQFGAYADEPTLVINKFLSAESGLHDIIGLSPTAFDIGLGADAVGPPAKCGPGAVGTAVNGTTVF
jgi:general secretion pathway protein G